MNNTIKYVVIKLLHEEPLQSSTIEFFETTNDNMLEAYFEWFEQHIVEYVNSVDWKKETKLSYIAVVRDFYLNTDRITIIDNTLYLEDENYIEEVIMKKIEF